MLMRRSEERKRAIGGREEQRRTTAEQERCSILKFKSCFCNDMFDIMYTHSVHRQ